jgi:hypothetical protein
VRGLSLSYFVVWGILCLSVVVWLLRPERVSLEWKPQDIWVGTFWRNGPDRLDVWVCLIPCVPLHVWWTK